MKQPIKKRTSITKKSKIKKSTAPKVKTTKRAVHHPKYGTSKLEEDFARDFLDKLGLKYVYQFETDIGRWFDFYLPEHNLLIEVDGSYYHSDPRLVKESEMNPMQKHNKRVDKHKDEWALMHGIPLIRIWEKDIRENPNQVMEMLKKRLYIQDKKVEVRINKNKRHINKIK
jgi:very-short-patch-repair endonuclease